MVLSKTSLYLRQQVSGLKHTEQSVIHYPLEGLTQAACECFTFMVGRIRRIPSGFELESPMPPSKMRNVHGGPNDIKKFKENMQARFRKPIGQHGDHAASSKTCPKFLEEQAILRYKAENGGTFQQARTAVVVEIHENISTRTFATAVKTQLRMKPAALLKDGGRSASSAPPKGKKPRMILRLSVPREQQKPK
ncbi:hypothetical protein PoB_006268000 [Plakobranchus ocellatus]|uniref:Uncharacterized protein n=1 Tax=Plakobranchus ocellatus TaxID=259542 RepID=A0AAV4CWC6_9GAST|nr:hypothetical protein PoB_006268000 [Plakobranchus ocellatus]